MEQDNPARISPSQNTNGVNNEAQGGETRKITHPYTVPRTLDHRRDLGAGEVQQVLDVHVVRREDQLEQRFLLHVHVRDVPLRHTTLREVVGLEGLVNLGHRRVHVALAVLQHLAQDGGLHVGQRDLVVGA